ncbi:MAG: Hsp20/alpha crystallin family protein [Planctomycetota bacterium]
MAADTSIEKQDCEVTRAEPTHGGPAFVPKVDIIEKPDELLLLADVPGACAEDIEIDYENGALSIHAKVPPRQDERQTEYLVNEFTVGDFHRSFQIGKGIKPEAIKAEVKDGVLTLHLPKSDALKPKKITVVGG